MATLILRKQNETLILPPTIFYTETENSEAQKATKCWHLFKNPLQAVGQTLRNAFYLPLYKKNIDLERELNQRLAEKIFYILQRPETFCSKELQTIRRYFSIRDMDVQIEGPMVKIFTVRLFESKIPIEGKKLRVILFSFNGNKEHEKTIPTHTRTWNPLTMEQLSKSPLSVLQAFKASGIRIDSLVTTSLGNVALDGLKYFPSESTAPDLIPPTLIINRGFTSVKKVTHQLYPFPLNYILYGAAKLCGWDANPEQELLNYLEKTSIRSMRKIVVIEARKDFYFSDKAALAADLHEKIAQSNVSVFRAKFWPYPFHSRSHHALAWNHLENNSETEILTDTRVFPLDRGQTVSSAIAKNIFFGRDKDWHTCFCIGGADSTRDTGMVREVIPLLSAFIEEGEKGAQRHVDSEKQNAS